MPINTRKSANYSGQKIKFKDFGLGGQIKLIDLPEPLLDINVPNLIIEQFTFLSSSIIQTPVIYGGIETDGFVDSPYGYIWDSGIWKKFSAPAGDSGYARCFGSAANDDGNLLIIGGILSLFAGLKNDSLTWSPQTNSWSSATIIPGAVSTLAYEYPKGPSATNYRENRTYHWGGSDFPLGPGSETWRDQLVMWDGSSWTVVNTDTTVPPKDDSMPPHMPSLAAKDTGSGTELMLFTGSYNGVGDPNTSQAIYYWTQNSTSPVSGTWSYVTGSMGGSEINNMPTYMVCLMWEPNRSRWTAMSLDPNTSPNVWTSSDDGLTWNAYTYSIGSWSAAVVNFNSITQFSLLATPDPERSKFYITCLSSAGSGGYQELWELNVASTPSDSSLIKLYP